MEELVPCIALSDSLEFFTNGESSICTEFVLYLGPYQGI